MDSRCVAVVARPRKSRSCECGDGARGTNKRVLHRGDDMLPDHDDDQLSWIQRMAELLSRPKTHEV